MPVDPRLAARRRTVQEGWARRRLRWMMAIVGLVLLLGMGIALFRSPWLAVRTVDVGEVEHAPVAEILETHGLREGIPTVSVRPGPVEEALEAEPWVSEALVRVTWPGTVEVDVVERVAAAWVRGPGGWALATLDGMLVAAGSPEEGAPRVSAPGATGGTGDRLADPELAAAVEFLGRLTPERAVGATAEVTGTGIELVVDGHRVLAGNERDIAAKVATLEALLDLGVERGAVINVISPERPGSLDPRAVVEGIGEDVSSSDETG